MRLLLCAIGLVLSLSAAAADSFPPDWNFAIPPAGSIQALPPDYTLTPLLTVTSDRNDNTYYLGLLRDASGAPAGAYVQKNDDVAGARPMLFPDLAQPDGVVIFSAQNRNVLILQGAFDRSAGLGDFKMRYLTNGLFMTYDSCNVTLVNQGGAYFLRNAYTGATVTQTKVLTSRLGVNTLEGICPAN